MKPLRQTVVAVPIIVGVMASWVPQSVSQLTVFDPANYQENLLSSARALEQINNQVRQLQAQAQMLLRMDQNLLRLGSTISPDLQRTLGDIQAQLRAGDGIAMRLQATQSGYERLFPRQVSASLSADDVLRNAKSRWDEEYAALRRAALLQGQIADGVGGDVRLLGDAMARSKNAAGALEVAQAGNELAGLSVKQALQLQSLLAAQQRAEAFARARDLATEDEARQRFKSFIGTGSAYSASR
jgi:P-type conjugative transfer protein TrbJ